MQNVSGDDVSNHILVPPKFWGSVEISTGYHFRPKLGHFAVFSCFLRLYGASPRARQYVQKFKSAQWWVHYNPIVRPRNFGVIVYIRKGENKKSTLAITHKVKIPYFSLSKLQYLLRTLQILMILPLHSAANGSEAFRESTRGDLVIPGALIPSRTHSEDFLKLYLKSWESHKSNFTDYI